MLVVSVGIRQIVSRGRVWLQVGRLKRRRKGRLEGWKFGRLQGRKSRTHHSCVLPTFQPSSARAPSLKQPDIAPLEDRGENEAGCKPADVGPPCDSPFGGVNLERGQPVDDLHEEPE